MSQLTTASFDRIYENSTVWIGKSEVLRIDKVTADLAVAARIIPLASTLEVSLPNNFTVNEIGDYSVDLLWSDSLGHPRSCSLLREFSTNCKSGYIQQGKRCVKLCDADYIPRGKECEEAANTEAGVNMQVILGVGIGIVLALCAALLLFLIHKNPKVGT